MSAHAQEAGETVRIQGAIAEDTYAAGGTVDSVATVAGDLVVAGGRVTVAGRVSGDVVAAGGVVSVRAETGDDVRLAGGDVTLGGTVGDDAMVAGGSVTLMPDARVNGRAWFGGGRIDVAGTVGRELRAAGSRIVLSGQVHGNVVLRGQTITLPDSAVIDGDLTYRSPREAEIASGATIRGTVRHEPVESHAGAVVAAAAGAGTLVLLSLILTGSALFLLFPGVIGRAVATIRAEPWQCLGLGLALFAATPVVISVLFMTVIGWLPAVVIGVLYFLLLLAGFLTGTFHVGSLGAGLRRRGELSRARWLWSFVIALILILLLGVVPLLGQLLLFALLLLGMGALMLGMTRAYRGE